MNTQAIQRIAGTSKKTWALALARRYTRWKLSRGLDGVFAQNLERTQVLARSTPLIFAANHVSFWDSLLLIRLDEALACDGYVLMDRTNLRRLPFMSHLGAIPLSRNAPRDADAELRSAADLLVAPKRAVWIFPQGEHRPHHLRPLQIRPGVQRLVDHAQVPIVPVAIAYHFRHAPQPQVTVRFGPAIPAGHKDLCSNLEQRLDELLSELDAQYSRGAPLGTPLISSTQRSPETGIGARLLGGRGA